MSAIAAIEKFLFWITSNMQAGDAAAHVQVRGAIDEHTLITTSDSLMTVIEVLGARKLIGPKEFNAQADGLATKLSSIMKGGNGRQHSFGISFRSNPDVRQMLGTANGAARRTAARLGVDPSRMHYFDDQERALGRRCVDESVYLVALTHRAGLSPAERQRAEAWAKESVEKMSKAAAGIGGSRVDGNFGQSPRISAPALISRHLSMIENLLADLGAGVEAHGAGLLVRQLTAEEGIAFMRRQVDARGLDPSWRARLVGPSAAYGLKSKQKADQSAAMPIPVARQIITQGYQERLGGDAEIAQCGNLRYASLVMNVPPESGRGAFNWLAQRIGRRIPWSVGIEITPDGLNSRSMDKMYASFFGGLGDFNARVKSAWKFLQDTHKDNYVCAVRFILTTWAPSDAQVVENLSFLRSAVEAWESTTVTNETGSPALAAMATAAGLTKRSPADYMPGPMIDFARMLPMFRPASVWNTGQLLTHTREGRLYPVQFGSTQQQAWGVLGFAGTGAGKSFALSMMNFGIMMSAGLTKIPPLVVVDVGPGSSYVMKLVREMLPEHRKSEVAWLRVRNDKDHTVNPFDTQPGCDYPTEIDLEFSVNVLSTICSNLGAEGNKFCEMVIREAYRRFARNSPDCRQWQSSYDPELHEELIKLGYPMDSAERIRVWDIEDWLFQRGHLEHFKRIHRYAMPRLSDMVAASQAAVIQDQYGGEDPAMTPGQEPITKVFIRNITAAQTTYLVFSGFTKFDIGNARAVAIDLEEVVGSQSTEEGRTRSGLMFLFARRLGARNFFLRWEEMEPIVPPMYRDYYRAYVESMSEELKFLEYDEKHYTKGVGGVDKMIEVDLRVGRKYKMVTMMFSQELDDFPPACVTNCFTYFLMGKSTNASNRQIQSTFNLSDSEMQAVVSECVKPGVLFGMFRTTQGDTSQVLHTTAGPFMQWALSTSRDDVLLRNEMEKRLPYMQALEALTAVFPDGSVRDALIAYRGSRPENDPNKCTEAEIMAEKVMAALTRADRQLVLV